MTETTAGDAVFAPSAAGSPSRSELGKDKLKRLFLAVMSKKKTLSVTKSLSALYGNQRGYDEGDMKHLLDAVDDENAEMTPGPGRSKKKKNKSADESSPLEHQSSPQGEKCQCAPCTLFPLTKLEKMELEDVILEIALRECGL